MCEFTKATTGCAGANICSEKRGGDEAASGGVGGGGGGVTKTREGRNGREGGEDGRKESCQPCVL